MFDHKQNKIIWGDQICQNNQNDTKKYELIPILIFSYYFRVKKYDQHTALEQVILISFFHYFFVIYYAWKICTCAQIKFSRQNSNYFDETLKWETFLRKKHSCICFLFFVKIMFVYVHIIFKNLFFILLGWKLLRNQHPDMANDIMFKRKNCLAAEFEF